MKEKTSPEAPTIGKIPKTMLTQNPRPGSPEPESFPRPDVSKIEILKISKVILERLEDQNVSKCV